MGGDEYINKMDQQLPEATILLFRRLAHAKVLNFSVHTVKLLPPPLIIWWLDMMLLSQKRRASIKA